MKLWGVETKLIQKRGKLVVRLDFRPSKRIRRARNRIEKRQREIHKHFKTTQLREKEVEAK